MVSSIPLQAKTVSYHIVPTGSYFGLILFSVFLYLIKKIINMFKTLKQTLMCLVYIHINFQGDYMNCDIDIKCFDSFSHFLFIFLGVI